MGVYKLLILQLIGHVFADFFLQRDLMTRHKRRYKFQSKMLYRHGLIVFLVSYILSLQWSFIFAALAIFIVHLLVDGYKIKIGDIRIRRKKPLKNLIFIIDQSIHIITIFLVVFLYSKLFPINPIVELPFSNRRLLIILGYLLCLKPANIFIKELLTIYDIRMLKQTTDDLINAGKLIGNIERVLSLSLLLIGQYGAIGLIIAAKSILRYEGDKTAKTEYVLIGTLLSFGIAIIIGIIITKLNV